MATPNGMRRFARTISTKRDGTCEYCGRTTRVGVDWAGVNGEGKWTSVCSPCATSITEQVKAVIVSMNHLGDDADLSTIDMSVLPTVLAGQADDATSYDMLLKLTKVRAEMIAAKAAAHLAAQPTNPLADSLRTIATSATTKPGDRDFAASLVRWLDTRGPLTVKQQAAAERLVARYGTSTSVVAADLENGLYVSQDGTIHKLYNTQNDRQACKVLVVFETGVDEHGEPTYSGSFDYLKGGVRVVREAVADGTARALTQDEAAAFGRLHGFCCNCAIDIDDDRSLAAGYGPVCAKNHGWWYPTYQEAAEVLQRPVTTSTGRTYEPSGTVRRADGERIVPGDWRSEHRAHND